MNKQTSAELFLQSVTHNTLLHHQKRNLTNTLSGYTKNNNKTKVDLHSKDSSRNVKVKGKIKEKIHQKKGGEGTQNNNS